MSIWHRVLARNCRGFLGALSFALGGHSLCWADIWAFVDEKGVAHFATEPLDERYQLFARLDPTINVVAPAPKEPTANYQPVEPPPGHGCCATDGPDRKVARLPGVYAVPG